MKTFLGLPVIESAGLYALIKNYLSVILFVGIGYFLIAMTYGAFQGDIWKFVQSVDKYYIEQAVFLLLGLVFGHYARVLANKTGDRFFMLPKIDRVFYPLAFIIAYMVINEIAGF